MFENDKWKHFNVFRERYTWLGKTKDSALFMVYLLSIHKAYVNENPLPDTDDIG